MALQRYEHHLFLNEQICPFILGNDTTSGDKNVANWHRNIEVIVILDGDGYFQYGAEVIHVKTDDIIIVNSGTLHRPHSQDALTYDYLIIDEDFCLKNGIKTENTFFESHFSDKNTKELFLIAKKYIKQYQTEKGLLSAPLARNAVLSLLIDICLNHAKSKDDITLSQKTSEKYVKKVIEYISDNFTEPIVLDELAKMCNITKFHLVREFKRYTGQTVFTYINILKCKKAQVCLKEGLTVTETATECGFDNVSYFSQVYKKIMGVSPKEAKK